MLLWKLLLVKRNKISLEIVRWPVRSNLAGARVWNNFDLYKHNQKPKQFGMPMQMRPTTLTGARPETPVPDLMEPVEDEDAVLEQVVGLRLVSIHEPAPPLRNRLSMKFLAQLLGLPDSS